jgi:hypothetical protein
MLIVVLSGCASPEEKARRKLEQQEYEAKKAFADRRKKRAMSSGEVTSERWADVLVWDDTKAFNPATARFGNRATVADKQARTGEFRFHDGVRTKEFAAKDYGTKSAWLEKLNFGTKEAAAQKDAREAGKSAATKDYAVRDAREAGRTAAVPNVPDGERKFLGPEHDRMKRGIRPEDQAKFENSWAGELKPLTIEDVKKLLNKN